MVFLNKAVPPGTSNYHPGPVQAPSGTSPDSFHLGTHVCNTGPFCKALQQVVLSIIPTVVEDSARP